MDSKDQLENSFPKLGRELRDRLCRPVGQVSFWVNLVTGVILFGGIGVWFELLRYGDGGGEAKPSLEPVVTAMFTYFPALGWASAMQLVMADQLPKYLRSSANGMAAILLVLAVVFLFKRDMVGECAALVTGVVCCILAILMWWIANAREAVFQDEATDPEVTVGGPTDRPLEGSTGNFQL